ncbi:IS1595 family transposase [Paenibacillus sp. CGMCC 1.16610]|uniref:DDE transposase n=1 Tax=Paenibacillus anseongense TaxID=2682845 RepID=A0ABW9U6Q0_9BACL|nr:MULTISPECIES: transposase [Paenibacillus]MBA2940592.1 IS1595 family transposase [Paenibacillus sp. CGMCC 1.16610]MVQ35769.1 DDE transposase [Paenibacillus anseongense]
MDFSHMSFEQFKSRFSTEDLCAQYIFHMKWPEGFICPKCSHRHAYITKTRKHPLYECSDCRYQASLISGTIMEGSRTELRKWLLAIFLVSRTDQGTTAMSLSNLIQVTYKTAWLILHKIRSFIQNSDTQSPLSGSVRIHSAIYGRPFNPSVHRHPQEHLLLVGSSSSESRDSSYIKIKHVQLSSPKERHISRNEIHTFRKQHIETDTQNVEIITGFYTPKRLRPLLEIAKQASSWINQTFHGLGAKHLQAYLDEFCYRRNLTARYISIFTHLSELCFSKSAHTYT